MSVRDPLESKETAELSVHRASDRKGGPPAEESLEFLTPVDPQVRQGLPLRNNDVALLLPGRIAEAARKLKADARKPARTAASAGYVGDAPSALDPSSFPEEEKVILTGNRGLACEFIQEGEEFSAELRPPEGRDHSAHAWCDRACD